MQSLTLNRTVGLSRLLNQESTDMKKQTGFTLIEILIALVLGLIVISAIIGIYSSTITGSKNTVNAARLNYDLESVMSLMVNDIRRAGYWGSASVGADSSTNPFTTGAANIQIPTTSCILYSYDADNIPTPGNGEYYGFKLQSGAIRIHSSNAPETTTNCTATTGWTALTVQESVNVTALTFTAAYKCLNVTATTSFNTTCAAAATAGNLTTGQKAVESRQINISMSGELVNDTSVRKTLTSSVKVRNDRIFIQ